MADTAGDGSGGRGRGRRPGPASGAATSNPPFGGPIQDAAKFGAVEGGVCDLAASRT